MIALPNNLLSSGLLPDIIPADTIQTAPATDLSIIAPTDATAPTPPSNPPSATPNYTSPPADSTTVALAGNPSSTPPAASPTPSDLLFQSGFTNLYAAPINDVIFANPLPTTPPTADSAPLSAPPTHAAADAGAAPPLTLPAVSDPISPVGSGSGGTGAPADPIVPPSISDPVTPGQIVRHATTTDIFSDTQTPVNGQPINLYAYVFGDGAAPRGTVAFIIPGHDSGPDQVLGTAQLVGGDPAQPFEAKTALTLPLLGDASAITAVYQGDALFLGSTSAPLGQTQIQPPPTPPPPPIPTPPPTTLQSTTTTLHSNTFAPFAGQQVTLYADVTGASAVPTGSVAFGIGNQQIGTVAFQGSSPAPLTARASFTFTWQSAYSRSSFRAAYNGDAGSAGSTSAPFTLTNPPTITGSVTSDHNPANFGQAVTFTATEPNAGSAPTVTTFYDGATELGRATSTPAPNGAPSMISTLAISSLSLGEHSITASFSDGGTTSIYVQNVRQESTSVSLTSSANPSFSHQAVTFTATVQSSGVAPTGNVTFFDAGVSLGAAVGLSPAQPGSPGPQATLTTSNLTPGGHLITAVYNGDYNYNSVTSYYIDQVVGATALATISLTSSNNPAQAGQPVTFFADVTGSYNGIAPTGHVTFKDGAMVLGSANLGTPFQQGSLTADAPFTTTTLSIGNHVITAVYEGDTNYASVTSSALTQSVNGTVTVQHVFLGGAYNSNAGPVYSNYDAKTLSDIIGGSPDAIAAGRHLSDLDPVVGSTYFSSSAGNQMQDDVITVTYTATGGHFNVLTGATDGVNDNVTPTFTETGTAAQINAALQDVLFVVDPNFSGTVTISATSNDSLVTISNGVVQSVTATAPVTRTLTVAVTPFDDGAYEASIQSLSTSFDASSWDSSASQGWPAAASTPAAFATAAATPTGVRDGIDWSTTVPVRRVPDGLVRFGQFVETGFAVVVKTQQGNPIKLFLADPLADQPAATQAAMQDVSYNCHGLSFGARSVVCSDGKTRSFQIIDDKDVKTILADAYTEITADQGHALRQNSKKLVYVFYDKTSGEAVHSAVQVPGDGLTFATDNHSDGSTTLNVDLTTVGSKNGGENLKTDVSLKKLQEVYKKTEIKIYTPK